MACSVDRAESPGDKEGGGGGGGKGGGLCACTRLGCLCIEKCLSVKGAV